MPTKNAFAVDGDKLNSKQLLTVLTSIKKGDFSTRLPFGWTGIDGKVADTLNDIIEMMAESTNNSSASTVSSAKRGGFPDGRPFPRSEGRGRFRSMRSTS